jgi:hypothetical protein
MFVRRDSILADRTGPANMLFADQCFSGEAEVLVPRVKRGV